MRERLVEHDVDLLDRGGGEARIELAPIEALDVGRRERLQPEPSEGGEMCRFAMPL